MPDFRVNLFDVNLPDAGRFAQTPFREAIENACGQPLAARVKEVNGKRHRLENYAEREGCLLLNFITGQYAGPGRTEFEVASAPIGLGPNESFTYDTAALYDPEKSLVFLESSVLGMREGALAGYLKEFTNGNTNYSLSYRIDPEAAAKARRFQTITSMIIRVSMGPATESDRRAGVDTQQVFGAGYGADFIDIEMKVEPHRGRSLLPEPVRNAIDRIVNNFSDNHVTQFKLKGREHNDDEMKLIDLLSHREKRNRPLDVDPATRKIPYESRWEALLEIRREYLSYAG